MTGDKLAAERQEFEAWWNNDESVGPAIDGSHYKAHAWDAWQAALRSAPDCPQKDSSRVGVPPAASSSEACASRLPEGSSVHRAPESMHWWPRFRSPLREGKFATWHVDGEVCWLSTRSFDGKNWLGSQPDTVAYWMDPGAPFEFHGPATHQESESMPKAPANAAIIAAENFYQGSVHQGHERAAREYAYAMGYEHGWKSHAADRPNPPSVQREARETLADGSGSQPTVRKDGARSTSEGSEPRCGLFHYRWSSSHYPGYTVFRGNVPWVDACFVEEVAAAEYCRHRNALVDLNGSDALPPPESNPAAGSDEASPESK